MSTVVPRSIKLRRQARELEVQWPDRGADHLSCEYLRVFSPSAELRGHGLPEPMLLGGKREVAITKVEPVGRYAVRLVFDDGHDSGIYSWAVLRELADDYERNWSRYLHRLDEHGMSRDRDVVKLSALVGHYTPPSRPGKD